jgi:hypothetical protein
MRSELVHQILTTREAKIKDTPCAIEFEMAYQVRVAIEKCNGSEFSPAWRAVFLRLVPATPEEIERRRRNRAWQTHWDCSARCVYPFPASDLFLCRMSK